MSMGHIADMTSGRPRSGSPLRAKLPLLLSLAVLLLLAVLATRGGSAVPRGNGLILRGAAPVGRTITQTADFGGGNQNSVITAGLGGVVAIVLLCYLAAMVALIAALTTVRFRKARRAAHQAGQAEEEYEGRGQSAAAALLHGARAALLDLRHRAGGPPSDAVVRAWLVLEESAAESGTARRPDQTSTEFTADVLAAHDVDPAALRTLRSLYQRARFAESASATVTEADADAAAAALDRIADTLTVRARGAKPDAKPGAKPSADSGSVATP